MGTPQVDKNLDDTLKKIKDHVPGARLCSKQAAGELFWTNFAHSIGSLTGCKQVIDTQVKTDHYKALEKLRSEFAYELESIRWYVITRLFSEEANINDDIKSSLYSLVTLLEMQDDSNKKKIKSSLKLHNYIAMTSTIFLYIISFVLIVFVKWN
jgi:hypothetical protein